MTRPERIARGERHGSAKLTADDVVRMRALHAAGWKLDALAMEFHVSATSAWRIVHRETWAHVP